MNEVHGGATRDESKGLVFFTDNNFDEGFPFVIANAVDTYELVAYGARSRNSFLIFAPLSSGVFGAPFAVPVHRCDQGPDFFRRRVYFN